MIKSRIAIAGALLAVAGAASAAGFSATPAVVSDYDWRGLSQTRPEQDGHAAAAFQLGLNYGFESGFYVGAWGSNVDFGPGDPNIELDAFAGYAGGDAENGLGYDVGVNTYNYPSCSDCNFWEAYAGVSHGMFSAKLWYSPSYAGNFGDDPGLYIEGNLTYPLPSDFSLTAHVGHSSGKGVKAVIGDSYFDYSVGVGYNVGKFSLSLKYIDTDISGWSGSKVVAGITTTLPWGE